MTAGHAGQDDPKVPPQEGKAVRTRVDAMRLRVARRGGTADVATDRGQRQG